MEIGGRRNDLSRRDLVTTTATADNVDENFGPGTLGAGYGKVPQRWDFEADVVVIGSGAAGLPAAIKAVEAGRFRDRRRSELRRWRPRHFERR